MPRGPSSVIARRPFVSAFIVVNCFALSMQQSTTSTPQSNYLVLSMLQSTTDTPQATRSDARASGGADPAAAVQRDRDSASGTDRDGPVAAGPFKCFALTQSTTSTPQSICLALSMPQSTASYPQRYSCHCISFLPFSSESESDGLSDPSSLPPSLPSFVSLSYSRSPSIHFTSRSG